jgi:hypothetical protein
MAAPASSCALRLHRRLTVIAERPDARSLGPRGSAGDDLVMTIAFLQSHHPAKRAPGYALATKER